MNKLGFSFLCGSLLAGCCTGDFIIPSSNSNDDFTNAIDVTSLIDIDPGCNSSNPIYSTVDSSPDGGSGSCWSNSDNSGDVWFKFTNEDLNGYISIHIKVGDTEGTQRQSQLVLWDTDGITELDCDSYEVADDDLYLFYGNLVFGEIYYFSVSVADVASRGTFSLCVTTSD